jgi:hypothetical protein
MPAIPFTKKAYLGELKSKATMRPAQAKAQNPTSQTKAKKNQSCASSGRILVY